MYEDIVNKKGNRFYSVEKRMVDKAQDDLEILFPDDLVRFYSEIGYGFLASKEENINRIMDPTSVCDFRQRKGQFANNSELDAYDDYERDKLVFFEVCEGYYLSIGFSEDKNGVIFDGNNRISDSLKGFLIRYQEDEHFF